MADRLNDLDGKDWIRHTISHFEIKTRSRNSDEINHPAKFPEELALRFIELLTRKGEWVIDPFAGVGSTLTAADKAGRNAVGIELVKDFYKVCKKKIKKIGMAKLFTETEQFVIHADSRRIAQLLEDNDIENNSIALCMTSPPYWNMLTKSKGNANTDHKKRRDKGLKLTFSNLKNDMGNMKDYNKFMDELIKIFTDLKPYMKKNGYLVIICQNFRDENGEVITMAWDLAKRLNTAYKMYMEQVWIQKDKKAIICGYPYEYVGSRHHHYCIVLKNSR